MHYGTMREKCLDHDLTLPARRQTSYREHNVSVLASPASPPHWHSDLRLSPKCPRSKGAPHPRSPRVDLPLLHTTTASLHTVIAMLAPHAIRWRACSTAMSMHAPLLASSASSSSLDVARLRLTSLVFARCRSTSIDFARLRPSSRRPSRRDCRVSLQRARMRGKEGREAAAPPLAHLRARRAIGRAAAGGRRSAAL